MTLQEKIEHWLDSAELETLANLNTYYLAGRYPAYKQKLSHMVDKETAQTFLKQTEEVFLWLKSQL